MTNTGDTDTCDTWLSYAEAAKRLGVSVNAIKQRVKRGALLAARGNDGQPRVSLPKRHGDTDTAKQARATPTPATPSDPVVPLSIALEMVAAERSEGLRQWSERAQFYQDQIGRLERELAGEHQRHEAEIERLMGQVRAERSFWVERADAAEVRAEQADQRAAEATARLADLSERLSRPWWKRRFR